MTDNVCKCTCVVFQGNKPTASSCRHTHDGYVLRQATTLRQIAEWCDNPNLSPSSAVKIKTNSIDGNLFSTGYLLRIIAECYENKALHKK